MIKAVIFDLAEVLLTGVKDTGTALKEKYNLNTGDSNSPLWVSLTEEFFHGNVSEDDYLEEVVKKYPEIGNKEELKKHIRANFIEVEGTREVILNLKAAGYKLALLSVHGREWIEHCHQKFNHHELFDVVAYSYDDKVSKPNARAYELVVERLGVKPEECVFIDDNLANVEAAKKLGILGIQFFHAKQLRGELKEMMLI